MGHVNHFNSNRYDFPSPLLVSNVDYDNIGNLLKMLLAGLEDSSRYYVKLN